MWLAYIRNLENIVGIVFLSAIGFVVIISIIGFSIYLTRKNPIHGKNKIMVIAIGLMQAIHVLLYFTGTLAMLITVNVYISFAICVFLSFVCLLLSLWLVLPFAKLRNTIKYMLLFFAVIQVLTTIVIFSYKNPYKKCNEIVKKDTG